MISALNLLLEIPLIRQDAGILKVNQGVVDWAYRIWFGHICARCNRSNILLQEEERAEK